MFFSVSAALLLAASASAVPNAHQLRNVDHNGLAKRVESHLLSKRFYSPRVTWYPTNTGPDACTGKNHGDNDALVAINTAQWNNGAICGKRIRITANGKTAEGVISDLCASCPENGQIDLTKGLFQKFASLDKGIFTATWEFVDGNGGGGDPEPPKATPKTSKSTPKPTPTKTEKPAEPTPPKNEHHEAAPTPSKKPAPQPTKAAVVDNEEDDDEEYDDDCEEYEDDEEEAPEPVKVPEPVPEPVKEDKPVKENKPVKESPVKATPPKVTPSSSVVPVRVDSTPSSIVIPSSSVPVVAPTVPVANPAVPTESPAGDSGDISGGISQSSLGNSAASITYNKVVPAAIALFFLAVQAL